MPKLLKIIGAIPFLIAVFLNTVVDLGHKIVIQNTIFKVYSDSEQVYLTAIVNGLILLPFILLFVTTGRVCDQYAKTAVMRRAAWAAVILTVGITIAYTMGWFWLAFGMTFLLAVQSAFYSPAKYGYIKSLFGKENLATGNGLVQAVSIVGILSGTLIFSILFEAWYLQEAATKGDILSALVPIGFILIATSVIELIMTYRLVQIEPTRNNTFVDNHIKPSFKQSALDALAVVTSNRAILLPVIGIAVFWSVGQVMLAAFPAFAKAQTGETNTIIIQAILASSGLGIALGSMIAARYSRNYIETGLVSVGAAGVALGLLLLPTLESHSAMALDFFFIGCMGGMFIVPLNALIQFNAREDNIGQVLAANNLIQNLSMFGFLILTVVFSLVGIASKYLLFLIAIVSVVGFVYTVVQIPQSLVRFVIAHLINSRYKVNVDGMKNIPAEGGVLLLGNHISWIDWAIIQISCPRPVRFVMIRSIYERWYLSWFFKLFGCVPIEAGPSSKASLEAVTHLLDDGEVVCLFPEGTISRNGHLGEFKRGFEKSAKAANDNVVIIPFYMRGLWGSQFSRSAEQLKAMPIKGLRRELFVSFGPIVDKNTDADALKRRVFDLSISTWQRYTEQMPSLPHAWIETVKRTGASMAIADTLAEPLSAHRALTAAILFSKPIQKNSPEHNIGLLLPTSSGGVIANMAVLLAGKTIVNLNYTASEQALHSAVEQAAIQTVYTSKRFIDKLAKRGVDLSALLAQVNVVYLEDLKKQFSKVDAFKTLMLVKCLPVWALQNLYCKKQNSQDPAAILFSSGSEGLPKGVQLSHQNIMANLKQVAEVLNAEGEDVIMASLPLFHAFGLTVTQFLPLIQGLPMVCHADPTDGFGVAKAVARYRATVMFGTSTFLRLYTRDPKVKPLMFDSLRLIVAGAEKLNQDVRTAFKLKFGKDVYEGYGATETAPVAGVNLPDKLDTQSWKIIPASKKGAIGMPLPGTSFKIVDPESFAELPVGEDGMILIGGPQIMLGYLNNPSKTEQVIYNENNIRWYITGDKGHLDKDGFLSIIDRYSRFAKVGGEMISLSEIEETVRQCLASQEMEIVAVNVADDKKGEKIILLAEDDLDTSVLKKIMLEKNINPLLIPAQVVQVDAVPKLGSGKTDFSQAKAIAVGIV